MALGATLDGDRTERRAQARGRGSVLRLLRDRAGEERADRRGSRPVAGRASAPPTSRSPPARPTTGRRSASRRSLDGDGKSIKSARIVASAATDKATRLKAAEAVLNGKTRRRQAARSGRRGGRRGSRVHRRRARLGAVQERIDEGLRPARGARGAGRKAERTDGRHLNPVSRQGRLAGRPLGAAPRRPRQGHRPRRIHPHHAAARHAVRQALPQHGRARQHQVGRHQRREEAAGRAARRHRRRRDEGAEEPLLRPGVPRPADPGRTRRCASSASRSPPSSPPIRTSPSRRCSSSPPNTRNCPRSSTRSMR